jgi:ABC-type multidrug transport system ATPase subunit
MQFQPVLMAVGVIRFMVSGIILGLSALNAGDDAAYMEDDDVDFKLGNDDIINDDSFSVTSTLFFMVTVTLLGLTFSVPYMNSHFRMIKSEIVSGIYHPISAWVAIMILDIPSQLAGSLFLGLVIRLFLGLNGEAPAYFSAVVLCALAGISMASAVAAAFQSAYQATQVYMSITAVMMLFAGYLQYIPDMPAAFAWLSDLSIARWSFEALMLSSFQSSKTGEAYLDLYGFDGQSVGYCMTCLLLWVLFLQLGVLLGLYPIQYQSVYARLWGRQQSALTTSATVGTAGQRAVQGAAESDISYLLSEDGGVSDDVINFRLVDSDFGENDDRYLDGTYHIPQAERKFSDDEQFAPPPVPVELLPANKRTSLSFQNVGYTLLGSQPSFLTPGGGEAQEVLRGITGAVYPGDLCCILDADDEGANGVLVQVLAGRASKTGLVTGEIHMSGKLLQQGDRTHNAVFVMSGDSPAHSHLTVRETLRFATLLRRTDQRSCPLVIGVVMESASVKRLLMNQGDADRSEVDLQAAELIGSSGQVEEKVEELLRIYDLEEVADNVVGRDKERGISPSHLRCLSIATEAVNRPGLLFLPDPLSQLDWYHTERVCRVLRALANGDRTLICTIPNPTDQIYSYFNRTLLLNKGLLMYSGPSADAREHFDNIGMSVRLHRLVVTYFRMF